MIRRPKRQDVDMKNPTHEKKRNQRQERLICKFSFPENDPKKIHKNARQTHKGRQSMATGGVKGGGGASLAWGKKKKESTGKTPRP